MLLRLTINRVGSEIDLPGVDESDYERAGEIINDRLKQGEKNRDAIAAAFLHLLKCSPNANPSDLWHHVVYRHYIKILPEYRPQDAGQSWKRASGDALEVALQEWYRPVFSPHRIRLVGLFNDKSRRSALEMIGISGEVGGSKLDMGLYVDATLFGGLHVKTSLAERMSDDVPCSRAMMRRGFFSALWTLDVKSFPPPHGDLINRGELGSPNVPSDKRRYIEEHGDFDNCYSANARTIPSIANTQSGKRIYTLRLSNQPDQFALDVIARVNTGNGR